MLEKKTKLEQSVNQMNAALTELKEKNSKLEGKFTIIFWFFSILNLNLD